MDQRLATLQQALEEKPRRPITLLRVAEWSAQSGFDKLPNEVRQRHDPLQVYIDSLKQEREENQRMCVALQKFLEIDSHTARDTKLFEMQSEKYADQISMYKGMYNSIMAQIQTDQLHRQSEGYEVRVIMDPTQKK